MFDMLFSPYSLGKIKLKNRIVMAPMTRNRSPENIPSEMVTRYYSQRSNAGLIITEGTAPSLNGLGYPRIPGLFNSKQMLAWKSVTDQVHNLGGKIFVQLMHTGRVSHLYNMPPNTTILAPSAIPVGGQIYTDKAGMQNYPVPKEMSEMQIHDAIKEFGVSAELAMTAGFDGVEIHSANGYLLDQFINLNSNQRTDKWGGSIENRIRFTVQVAKEISGRIGANCTGIRLSPYGVFNDMGIDANIEDTFIQISKEMNQLNLLYIHIVDHSSMGSPEVKPSIKSAIRKTFGNTLILSGGYDGRKAEMDLIEKKSDLIAFGRPFLANPDLVDKIKKGIPLTTPDTATFYTAGEKGYNDYV